MRLYEWSGFWSRQYSVQSLPRGWSWIVSNPVVVRAQLLKQGAKVALARDQWQTWVFEMLVVGNPNPSIYWGSWLQRGSLWRCWWMLIVYRLYMCEMCPASMTMCRWTHRATACHNIWRHRHASRRTSSTGRGAAPAAIHAWTLADLAASCFSCTKVSNISC